MSGDIGLEQPIVFYSKEMTEAKQILLRHKGIELAYLEINRSAVQVGMDVHAIGHPEGEFCTYTQGVTSRIISDYDWSYSSTSLHKANVIQTQTPINPGNSGGPLISDMGKVIGINTFKHPSAVGINFAVSATEINDFLINGSAPPIPASTPDCSEDEPMANSSILVLATIEPPAFIILSITVALYGEILFCKIFEQHVVG